MRYRGRVCKGGNVKFIDGNIKSCLENWTLEMFRPCFEISNVMEL